MSRSWRSPTDTVRASRANTCFCQGSKGSLLPMSSHLVGLSEIAQMLGVSRQRVGQLVQDYEDFPSPAAELASGRIWETSALETWEQAHPVRRPGRPVRPGRVQRDEE